MERRARERKAKLAAMAAIGSRNKLLPAKRVFALGVGHVRRQGLTVGSKSDEPGVAHEVTVPLG